MGIQGSWAFLVAGVNRDESTQRLPLRVVKVDGGGETGSAGMDGVESKDRMSFFFKSVLQRYSQ